MVFPSYREVGVLYTRGAEPGDFVRVWCGEERKERDTTRPSAASRRRIIIVAQMLHAVGYAMGIAHEGADEVVTYFGDGATSQSDVNEAMIFASFYWAPVVFVCQNPTGRFPSR